MAGVSRLQYTTDIELIRVMCSGRVDLEFVFRALARGADGVFIGGCRLGECNYLTHGNYHALNMVHLCQALMRHLGINPDRLQIAFMSSGEGPLFAETVDQFRASVAALGPLGSSEGMDQAVLGAKLKALRGIIPYIKMALREKLQTVLAPEEYAGFYSDAEIEELLGGIETYAIDPDKCQACMICGRKCPVQAITGGKGQVHVIDQAKCIRCGTCLEACPDRFGAVRRTAGPWLDLMALDQAQAETRIGC